MKLNNLFPRLTHLHTFKGVLLSACAVGLFLTSSCQNDTVTPDTKAKLPSSARGAGQGTDRGYFWTLWSGGGGTSDISFPNSATYPGQFRITYTNDACVGGKGWATGTDTRVINYNVGYLTGASTYNSVGVYGWVQTPLIEYYVNEAGFTPFAFGQYYTLGDVWVDGRKYVFSRHLQEGKASIEGDNKTFWQYIDNISTAVVFNGNKQVSMKGHVDNWKKYGGKGWGSAHNYQVFAIEAFGGKTGTIDASIW